MENENVIIRIIYLIFNDEKIEKKEKSFRKLAKIFHLNKSTIEHYKKRAFEDFSDLKKEEDILLKEKIKKFHLLGESTFDKAIEEKKIEPYGKLMLSFSLAQLIYIFETLITKNGKG